jgi:DNA polymerase-3 subunit epsilon
MFIAGFDLETTGLDGMKDHIVQYSFQLFRDNVRIQDYSSFVNPGVEVTATEIHGITTADVQSAPSEESTIIRIDNLFRASYLNNIPVVIMNAQFDISFYRDVMLTHYGLKPTKDFLLLDPLVIDKHFDKYRPGKRNLESLANYYGIKTSEEFHNAHYDVTGAVAIARQQLAKWDLGNDWFKLHELQAQWSDEQLRSLHQYFISSNREFDRIPVGWPIAIEMLT